MLINVRENRNGQLKMDNP